MLKKFRLNRDQKGFTLIELLIVVAIIGILAAIAIPQFASYRERAFHTASQSDLRNFKTSMEAYYADNQEYPAAFVAGANFIVRWESPNKVSIPVIQAVMIGTASTQGISFVCDGVVLEER